MRILLATLALVPMLSCASTDTRESAIRIAHLGRDGGDAEGFAELRALFRERNPGYDVEHLPDLGRVEAGDTARVVFVQTGPGKGSVGEPTSELDVGDIVLLRPGQSLLAEGELSGVAFRVPEPLPDELPPFVRPDWDPDITDTPGGCAEETGAYRRILLTWLPEVGPYVYHALNAHRVRIMDSFSHYHPVEGGFDEFYLVQMVMPEARLLTSDRVDLIEDPDAVSAEQAGELLDEHPLEVGDLVYLPRGTMHRGVGGVLAQVITAPGFRPGAEIGVDHHLRAIDERLGLAGEASLPYHEKASVEAVVK